MPIRFLCAHCQKPLAAPTRKAGSQVACPVCSKTVAVPSPLVDPAGVERGIQSADRPVNMDRPRSIERRPPADLPSTAAHVRNTRVALIDRRIVGLAAAISLLFVGALVAAVAHVSRLPADTEPALVAEAAELAAETQAIQPVPLEPRGPAPKTVDLPPRPPPAMAEPVIVDEPAAPATERIAIQFVLGALTAPVPQPQPAPAPPPAKAPTKFVVKRLHHFSDEDLRKQLLRVPELSLDRVPGTTAALLQTSRHMIAQSSTHQQVHLVPNLVARRPDLMGLPLHMGADCQLGKEPAENLHALSKKLRTYITEAIPKQGGDPRPDPAVLRAKLLEGEDGVRREWQQAGAIPTLKQMLMAENVPSRLLLVDLLAEIRDHSATVALAERALFDLSPEVRQAALEKLEARPRDEYRSLLMAGFRYPWAPASDHAAEALVAVHDYDAIPQLRGLVSERDPNLPMEDRTRTNYVVREMVRINHLGNCMLCHAPSLHPQDLVRGVVPIPGRAPSMGYAGGAQDIFVRADVTYLKQDFSVPQPVEKPGLGPANQRYDYLVRTRAALADDFKRKPSAERMEAIRYALNRLSKD
jgi:hypothetical protein